MYTSFYTEEELKELGFKHCGKNVQISRKASFYGIQNISIGDHVRIDDFCLLSGHIELGSYIHIAAYAAMFGGTSGIYMEDFSGLSSRTTVYAASDDYSGQAMTNPTVPDRFRRVKDEAVHIGRHALIGASCVVLPGVTVAEGSSFGVFSFIDKDSEPWSVNVGIPFRKIKDRSRHLLELEQQMLAEEG